MGFKKNNYGITVEDNVKTLNVNTMNDFDILCAGFPCQTFSQAGNKKTFDDDNEGDVLDGGKDFGRPSVVLDSDSISKSRNKFSSNSHNKPKPHELVYRSASSDEDESHNVVPIDMHDLMSSIRKAAPGAANYGSGDDDDENQRIITTIIIIIIII